MSPSFVHRGASYVRQFVKKFRTCTPTAAKNLRMSASYVLRPIHDATLARALLDTSKPTALRLAGFLATVVGGALVAFGAALPWARDNLVGAIETRGIDTTRGLIALAIGALGIVGIVALRAVAGYPRRWLALGIAAAGIAAIAISIWTATTAQDAFHEDFVEGVMQQAHVDRADAELLVQASGISSEIQFGLWLVLGGGALLTFGGALDFAWAATFGPVTEAPPS